MASYELIEQVLKCLDDGPGPDTKELRQSNLYARGLKHPVFSADASANRTGYFGKPTNVVLRRVYAELHGAKPSASVFKKVVKAFNHARDLGYRRKPHTPAESYPPIGAGSPYYVTEGELSPSQENAIRILEDG
jgi:hypothetical protein